MNALLEQIEAARARLSCRHPLLARLEPLLSERFLKFLLVGALNTLVGYVVFLLALWLTGHSILSLAISWIFGILFNFRTTGRLVFDSQDDRLLARFVGVYVAVFCINASLLRALEWLGLPSAVAALLLTPPIAALTFLLMRAFVFSASGSKGHAA